MAVVGQKSFIAATLRTPGREPPGLVLSGKYHTSYLFILARCSLFLYLAPNVETADDLSLSIVEPETLSDIVAAISTSCNGY